jgi:hypothetical protein
LVLSVIGVTIRSDEDGGGIVRWAVVVKAAERSGNSSTEASHKRRILEVILLANPAEKRVKNEALF